MYYTIDSWYILLPAFILFLVTLFIGTRKKDYRAGQYFLLITLAIYLLAVIHLVFFPVEVYSGEYKSSQPLLQMIFQEFNFIPILTIDTPTFVLNIIMLIPFGVYLPLLNGKVDSAKKAAKYGFFLSLLIEVIQLTIEVTLGSGRIADIFDIIANTLGAAVGFLIIRKLVKIKIFNVLVSKLSLAKSE
ncbi:glycopeptide antibiotics resistance protein [Bacillus niacini]|uniref:Glycopeptide antibiotics resistance protein n=1 Tax=Neobacillus niacini TaxID=86668 RepID=A0A852T9N8_9BACI|nr:VanZ family protein [Neobacillus niacini]NYE04497.1 glycopeptide antibiotics resistance protein [Neobacillus niacini]